jgi:hypothetical protein
MKDIMELDLVFKVDINDLSFVYEMLNSSVSYALNFVKNYKGLV